MATHVDREGRIRRQEVGEAFADGRAVGIEAKDEPASLCLQVNLPKIRMHERLSAGDRHPQHTGIRQLVENSEHFVNAELPSQMRWGIERIGVAVDAVNIAPVGDLDLHPGGLPVPGAPVEDSAAEVPILSFRDQRTHVSRLSCAGVETFAGVDTRLLPLLRDC